jgi:hypothetical protein
MCDNFLDSYTFHETHISVFPGFEKKPLQPFAFIARHTDPKGLFQVLQKGATSYFMSLTTQPIRVYREVNEHKLIELPYFEFVVRSCQNGYLSLVDKINKIKVDKFIEIGVN